jgi:uncharacterized OB-fold protein
MTLNINKFAGTPLSEGDFQDGKILFNHDELKGNFAWDTGIAIGTYLAGLKSGKMLGALCTNCNKIVIPPRTVCEWCFRPMDEYLELPDTGTVNTFSLCYVTWDVKRIKEPEIPAVIHIDGTSSLKSGPIMGGIMHMLGEVDPEKIEIGMRVQAVWKAPEDREGSITDILYFKPISDESESR